MHQLTVRIPSDLAQALAGTAKRLNQSVNKYTESALRLAISLDADEVVASNDKHSAEVARLAEEANEQIAFSNPHRWRRSGIIESD
jgi:hypothetical protein